MKKILTNIASKIAGFFGNKRKRESYQSAGKTKSAVIEGDNRMLSLRKFKRLRIQWTPRSLGVQQSERITRRKAKDLRAARMNPAWACYDPEYRADQLGIPSQATKDFIQSLLV